MTSVIPVHSVLRAIALACSASNPARRKTSRVTSVARSAASFRFSCSSSNCAAAECARSTATRDSSSPWSWAHHGASGSVFTSISPQTCSATPSSRSSLLRKCQYKAIGVTPRCCASLRMVSASNPSASASLSAFSVTVRLLSLGRSAAASPGSFSFFIA